MRPRPIRPFIYQPTMLFGVRLGDWKFIAGAVFTAFVIPLLLNIRVYGLHLSPVLAVFCLLAGTAFFNYVRMKRRPRWLEHEIAFYWREATGRGQDIVRHSGARHDTGWILGFEPERAKREKWLFSQKK